MSRSVFAFAAAGSLAVLVFALPATSQGAGDTPDIAGFEELDVSAGMQVVFSQAPDYSIDVEMLRGERDDVRIERDGDTLEIGRHRRLGWAEQARARITLTGPRLDSVDVSSGASLEASAIAADDFDVDVSSGASATLAGACRDLDIDASSGASLDASGMECVEGDIDASSGASVQVRLTGTVEVDASSGASVRVKGGARATEVERSSGASVKIEPAQL